MQIERHLNLSATNEKLDKLSRLADPARNNNPYERAVASVKLDKLKAKLPLICGECHKPMKVIGGKYECFGCIASKYVRAVDRVKHEREKRQNKRNCIIMACIGIVAFSYLGYHHFTDPPVPLTMEEKIQAKRLAEIDAKMEALQNQRDEIDPPQVDESDRPTLYGN
jgi:hypothetical protein